MSRRFFASQIARGWHLMAKRTVTFYNVEAAVGQGRSNRPDDVALVRFFLKRLGGTKPELAPLKTLPINTNFAPDLKNAILHFQTFAKAQGKSIAVDGVVDPAKFIGQGVTSTVSHTRYTIAILNANYRVHFPQFHDNITKDPDCPPILTSSFKAQETEFGY
jgi:hypothetical protein